MGKSLIDRVAVVTGGGRGIGRAVAILMAKEGARVVVNDLGVDPDGSGSSHSPADDVVQEINDSGGMAVANHDSVASLEGGQSIIKTAITNFNRIDILVNNAGIFGMKQLVDMSEQEWDTFIQVNLKGHFACTKSAIPYMIEQKYGRIINMSSMAALGPAGAGATHYATAKAGILGFTRSLSRELGQYGITVNAVMPVARTRMVKMVSSMMQIKPQRSPQTPDDIAPIVVYLASDSAGNINGATFSARIKGLIQLINDPKAVNGIYRKRGWSLADLSKVIPKTMAEELVNPAPPNSKD